MRDRNEPSAGARQAFLAVCPVLFAVRDWTLNVLLAEGDAGPPARAVFLGESVERAGEDLLRQLLRAAPPAAVLVALSAGWRELPLRPGEGDGHQGIYLVSAVLLQAGLEALQPAVSSEPVGELRARWVRIAEVESGRVPLAPEWQTLVETARDVLREEVQRSPELLFAYLGEWLTLAEASLLYRALLRPGEQVDESNLRKRLLATGRLVATDVERSVRGREHDWRRVGKVYRYVAGRS